MFFTQFTHTTSKGVDVTKPIVKFGEIPSKIIISELIMKGVLYEGPDHYVLQGGEHTNCFFYPFRVRSIVTLPLRLQRIMEERLLDRRDLTFLAVSDTATRMMRSMFSTIGFDTRKVYPETISGQMELKVKQVALLQKKPFIIIDDVVRKGVVLQRVLDVCKRYDLTPEGVICAINGGISDIQGVQINSLLEYPIQQWSPTECPLCKKKNFQLYDPYRFKR